MRERDEPWPSVLRSSTQEYRYRFRYVEGGEAYPPKGADATGRYLTIVKVSDRGLEYPTELLALMTSV
jgi:hypothetical protein